MDKQELADLIRESVAEGEDPLDFQAMVQTLVGAPAKPLLIRTRTQRVLSSVDLSYEAALGRAWYLCLFVKPKPPEYVSAMHDFRLRFAGIASSPDLRRVFRSALRPTLLRVNQLDPATLKPSIYFDADRAERFADQLGVTFVRPESWY